ncbi:MAG: hypothetical protein ACLFM0_11660, partial [Spirochaetales bacterium]
MSSGIDESVGNVDESGVRRESRETGRGDWTFLTNHSHVLLHLAQDPNARLRDVAYRVGITERAVQNIVQDLEHAGVLERRRDGRRNRYRIHGDQYLRHPVEWHCRVADLLQM